MTLIRNTEISFHSKAGHTSFHILKVVAMARKKFVKKWTSKLNFLSHVSCLHIQYAVLGPASPGSGRFYFVIQFSEKKISLQYKRNFPSVY